MRVLMIDLPEETAARIEDAARQQGISPEDLIVASVEEKLARDADFEAAAKRVLAKNVELYDRLA